MFGKKKKVNVNSVDINDPATKSPFPLIEKPKGTITYEHCLPEGFYGEQYLCSAERNYYVDRYHELCLLAHYGKRTPGKYEIVPGYEFFVTKKRMCLDIYWNLGHLSDESVIVERYDSLESAKQSEYYADFCDLKDKIDDGIKWAKNREYDPFEFGGGSKYGAEKDENDEPTYDVYQYIDSENKQFIQLYQNIKTKSWDKMSISSEDLSDLMRFFRDFDELDKNELHLRTWLSINDNAIAEGSAYHHVYEWAKEFEESLNTPCF